MIKMTKRLLLLTLLCVVTSISPGYASITTEAKQAIVIDYNTGKILFEKNADEQMPTSSMSKVMTMYIVFEALKNGDVSLEDAFTVSEKAWKKGGSKMFVPVGKKVKIEDLVRGVIVQSGNDATIVLAEGLAGDEVSFASKMNSKARELGMNNSHFMNASGWPDPEHYSTARDLATLATAMIKNFPEYYPYYAEKEFTFSGIKQDNRNPLLYRDIGADGMKTGHTEAGGYGLIGTGMKDGRRVIFVVNGLESTKARTEEAVKILEWGLNNFKIVTLFKNNEELERAPVYLGKSSTVGLQAKEPVEMLVPKLRKEELQVEVKYLSPLKAPITKGQEVGKAIINVPEGEPLEVPLVTSENVEEMDFFVKLITKARLLTTGQARFE